MSFEQILEAGKDIPRQWPNKCKETDSPIFSYTSGTTGDSKGVKLTHKSLIYAVGEILNVFELERDDSVISYLPYPHSFEQCITYSAVMRGFKIGYY